MARISNRRLIANILEDSSSHSATVVTYATQLREWFVKRDAELRFCLVNREARRMLIRLRKENGGRGSRSEMKTRSMITQQYSYEIYKGIQLPYADINMIYYCGLKLRAYLAIENHSKSELVHLYNCLKLTVSSKEVNDVTDVLKLTSNYPNILRISPEEVSEILCWRLINEGI